MSLTENTKWYYTKVRDFYRDQYFYNVNITITIENK